MPSMFRCLMMSEEKKSSDYQRDMESADVKMSLVVRKGSTIIELMKGGLTPSRAAEVAEVSKNTVTNWIKRGLTEQRRLEEGGEPDLNEKIYMDFALGAIKAESEAQSGLVLAWFREARRGIGRRPNDSWPNVGRTNGATATP